jgi:glycine oxidase
MTAAAGPRVAIAGAGVIGVAIARALARRGAAVELIDAQDRSREASWAAGGMLAPHSEFDEPSPLFDLGRASLALYPALRDELREATGQDIDLRLNGTLLAILDDADEAEAAAKRAFLAAHGIGHRLLTQAQLRREEPALAHGLRGALETPDHAVDNRRLWTALAADAAGRGVTMNWGERIQQVEAHGGRITALHTTLRRIQADEFVLAAGAWSAGLAALAGFDLPAEPVKGQLIKFSVQLELLRRVVRRGHCYLVPRTGCELVAGATSEAAGFDREVTPEGFETLHSQSLALAPGLAQCPVIERWAGLRPRLADGLPALGRVPGFENLTAATGHYRNGILLTPITGEVIAAVVLGEEPMVDLSPFDPGRFSR